MRQYCLLAENNTLTLKLEQNSQSLKNTNHWSAVSSPNSSGQLSLPLGLESGFFMNSIMPHVRDHCKYTV